MDGVLGLALLGSGRIHDGLATKAVDGATEGQGAGELAVGMG